MIADDNELKQAVAIVDEHIQQIQDYLGQDPHADGKIRFPRNFIRTASHFRERLSFIKDTNIRDNLAYALIQSDVYRWLTNRTDIFGTAKEMIIKSGIALMGSICETMAIDSTKSIIGKRRGTPFIYLHLLSQLCMIVVGHAQAISNRCSRRLAPCHREGD
jgi:hypothetical protein